MAEKEKVSSFTHNVDILMPLFMTRHEQESSSGHNQGQVQDRDAGSPNLQDIEHLVGDIAIRMPNLVHIGVLVATERIVWGFWDVCRTPLHEGDGLQVSLKEIEWSKGVEDVWRAAIELELYE